MRPEDKTRFDAFKAGLDSMGLTVQFEGAGLVKTWILRGGATSIARIFYEENKPFEQRFSFMPVRSRQES